MGFPKNTAVSGFPFELVDTAGAAITTGSVIGYVVIDDGAQTVLNDTTPTHKGNGQWTIDLTAGEMNGDMIGLLFKHASGSASFAVRTEVLTSAAALVDAIWDEADTAHTTTGTYGKHIADIIVDTGTAGVAIAPGAIGTTQFTTGAINAAAIADGAITAAKFSTGAIDSSAIATGAITSAMFAAGSITGPAFGPGADVTTLASTATLAEKLDGLFALGVNKMTQSSTLTTLRNRADSANIGTGAVSDDGTTFTRDALST